MAALRSNGQPDLSDDVLLFGPLILSFDDETLGRTCQSILQSKPNAWLVDAIRDLPPRLEDAIASLGFLKEKQELVRKQVYAVSSIFSNNGEGLISSSPTPNAILVPLTVATQLSQFSEFIYQKYAGIGTEAVDPYAAFASDQHTHTHILGLCTGLLAAFVASAATTEAEFHRHGAAAIRLGLLIGLAIDSQHEASPRGSSTCMTVAWLRETGLDELRTILEQSSYDAYISVHYDDARATINAPTSSKGELVQALRAQNFNVADINLFGPFHHGENESIAAELQQFITSQEEIQLPDASCLTRRIRSTGETKSYIHAGPLHEHAIQSIIVDAAHWYSAVESAITQVAATTDGERPVNVVTFGSERCVPASLAAKHVLNIRSATAATGASISSEESRSGIQNDIAIVGMACKVSGAENVEEFWDLILAGESQHCDLSRSDRFSFKDTPFRHSTDPNMDRKWFANLISGHDQFDHRFFKKTARDSATMDPQQRQILQVAYQAVEQSGYLNKLSDDGASTENQDANVGCFLGVCLSDYDSNVSTHPANAFTATGNLQGFIAGRVSHFFGWTGPGLTIDTACSSSLVAIHQACNSILAGECTAALAGGSHIMSSAGWFQNLAAGSFLSPTGACKPFDAAADGYCRGEGIGAVFLKKMSAAIEDGDQILGVIGATAVQQNQNTTPIFVPNTPSLSNLLRNVTNKANVKPSAVSYVEAHGTGTPVGDPAEYGSIRDVFGGPQRMGQPLFLGSVKGLVGHMECTSGIISLIKVLLMINKGVLPKQASFNQVNPALNKRPEDLITIPTQPHSWDARQRVAVINNYGASGSNASMVVLEPPGHRETRHRLASAALPSLNTHIQARHPFWFSGADTKSLVRYAAEFRKYLDNIGDNVSIADISYHLAHQSNRSLDQALFFTAKSISELKAALQTVKDQTQSTSSSTTPTAILCFGGQTSTFVGVDQQVYDNVALLRTHLNAVDISVQSLGHRSIFPDIFQTTSINDVVQLQTLLFALQYACARCWMDCGVRPAALVGHSFGELTALAVSGILSLKDAINMIRNRATIIKELWGKDAGAMMAIEGDLDDVESLLRRANGEHEGIPASVACYNGRRSFTVAGSTEAVDAVAAELSSVGSSQAVFKSKRLKVTNAFHSALVDPLLDSLEESARTLTFREPSIWIESATEAATPVLKPTAKFIASHMREPVFFGNAIERLEARYGSKPCVFLEAGSSSTVTAMAARVLATTKTRHTHTFQGLNILGSGNGLNSLADSTLSLWKAGLRVQHWQHHGTQQKLNLVETTLLLPPYQFDPDSRHWLELRGPPEIAAPVSSAEADDKTENDTAILHHWESHADKNQVRAVFRLNTSQEKYTQLLSGHLTIQTAPICPATIQLGFVIDAIGTLEAKYKQGSFQPQIRNVKYHSPVCANRSLTTWIEVVCEQRQEVAATWDFEVFSNDRSLNNPSQARASHTTGQISFAGSACPNVKHHLDVFQRLFTHQRATELLKRSDADEILTNRSIYRLFAEIVDYGDEFKGLQKIVSHGNEVAGHVVRKVSSFLDPRNPDAGFDAHLVDTFCQLGGLFANSLTDREPEKVYLANGIDQWIRAPVTSIAKEFHVLATIHRATDRIFQADVFAFDAVTGALTEVILGVSYAKIPKGFMEKLLVRSTDAAWLTPLARASVGSSADNAVAIPAPDAALEPARRQPGPMLSEVTSQAAPKHAQQNAAEGLQVIDAAVSKIKNVVAELSGLEIEEIKDDSFLADLGIDSLVGMELINELNTTLKVKLPEEEAFAVVTMAELLDCALKAMGLSRGAQSSESSEYGNMSSSSNASSHGDASDSTASTSHPQSEADVAKPRLELSNLTGSSSSSSSCLSSTITNAFKEIQAQSDAFVVASNQEEYLATCFPRQNELAVAWTLDALEALGAGILQAQPGQQIQVIEHKEEHRKLVAHLYRAIQDETQLIKIDGDVITRTAVPPSISPSAEICDGIRTEFPDQAPATELIQYVGANLRSVLSGEVDGVKLIFGSQEGRELVSAFYADWPLNRVLYSQMIEFLSRALSDLSAQGPASGITESNPLRIMEMGGGTGGTTKQIVPMLAALKLPIEYTFTDLSPSFVAAARKRWAKQYPWMRFRVHDAESAPDDDSLLGSQHLVVASNVIHATKSIRKTTANVHKILRPDGFLLMLEMTRQPFWVDLIFGLFEGWWYSEDGRSHVLTHETTWKTDMQLAGYGAVQWTGGHLPETDIEKLILASANPETSRNENENDDVVEGFQTRQLPREPDLAARERTVAHYVEALTADVLDHLVPSRRLHCSDATIDPKPVRKPTCVLITGATGGLGTHLVADAALRPDVERVICLNRRSKLDPKERQMQSLLKKQINLPPHAEAKISVLETDLSAPHHLGLSEETYQSLAHSVTHIIHNAWLMHSKWTIQRFEPQLRIMANMLRFAVDVSNDSRSSAERVTFALVSSIATVGHHTIHGPPFVVPEERVGIESVLPTGYGDAKYTCERMLDATLHRWPKLFRATAVRLGQIAGSRTNGHWNPMEHVPFFIKSSQTLGALPDFPGTAGWTPADDIAAGLVDIATQPDAVDVYPVYHIENPVRQPWSAISKVLAREMGLSGVIPVDDWLQRVREWPRREDNHPNGANPAYALVDFLQDNFERISCGGLLMGTAHAREHSACLAKLGAVDDDLIRLYVESWKSLKFL